MPVAVVGGYLGAGKTTLLNELLAGDHGRRLAVLVNDFGAVNIDVDLIAAHDGETISLTNGCICCSIADSLGAGLDRALAAEPRPDQIVIEASGVANPAKVASYGQGWPGCRLDAVLVVADAETIQVRAEDRYVGELVRRQLRSADLVVLTKCDLLDRPAVQPVVDWLGTVTDAPVITRSGGTIDGELQAALLPPLQGHDTAVPPTVRTDVGQPRRSGGDGGRNSDPVFESRLVPVPVPIERVELERMLDALPAEVVRVKGIVLMSTAADPVPHLVNRVGHRTSIEPVPIDRGGTAAFDVLVVIAVQA